MENEPNLNDSATLPSYDTESKSNISSNIVGDNDSPITGRLLTYEETMDLTPTIDEIIQTVSQNLKDKNDDDKDSAESEDLTSSGKSYVNPESSETPSSENDDPSDRSQEDDYEPLMNLACGIVDPAIKVDYINQFFKRIGIHVHSDYITPPTGVSVEAVNPDEAQEDPTYIKFTIQTPQNAKTRAPGDYETVYIPVIYATWKILAELGAYLNDEDDWGNADDPDRAIIAKALQDIRPFSDESAAADAGVPRSPCYSYSYSTILAGALYPIIPQWMVSFKAGPGAYGVIDVYIHPESQSTLTAGPYEVEGDDSMEEIAGALARLMMTVADSSERKFREERDVFEMRLRNLTETSPKAFSKIFIRPTADLTTAAFEVVHRMYQSDAYVLRLTAKRLIEAIDAGEFSMSAVDKRFNA